MGSKETRQFRRLDEPALEPLKMAMTEVSLGARADDRILKVARAIADIAGSEQPGSDQVADAIQFGSLDRQIWR